MPPIFSQVTSTIFALLQGWGLRLRGATSGAVGLLPPAVAGSIDYILPGTAPAANGSPLVATTAGVMSWNTITGTGKSVMQDSPVINGMQCLGTLVFGSTNAGGLVVNSLTTTQRDALPTILYGTVIFNTTTGRYEFYDGTAWHQHARLDGDTFNGDLQFSGTSHAGLVLNSLTTTQRDALTSPTNGMLIYNTTTSRVETYSGGAWHQHARVDGDTLTGTFILTAAPTTTAAALQLSGNPLVNATSNPVFLVGALGTAGLWSANGTGIGINAPTGFLGHFLNFMINGGSTLFKVDSSGNVTSAGAITGTQLIAAAASAIRWTGLTRLFAPSDGFLEIAPSSGSGNVRVQLGGTGSGNAAFQVAGTVVTVGTADGGTTAGTVAVCGSINPQMPQTTLNGTTAGSVIWSQPFQGSAYKRFVAYFNGYKNSTAGNQTITFPTAFTQTPIVSSNTTGLPSAPTVSTSTLTIVSPNNSTTYTGFVIVEGY